MSLRDNLIGLIYTLLIGRNIAEHFITTPCGADIDFDAWNAQSPPASDYRMLQAHLFIRHGDRIPTNPRFCWTEAPTKPVWNCSQTYAVQPANVATDMPNTFRFEFAASYGTQWFPGNCLVGQLTELGFRQLLTNGRSLRARYMFNFDMLPASLKHVDVNDIVNLRADHSRRTQQSAIALFDGLYDTAFDGTSEKHHGHHKDHVMISQTVKLWMNDPTTDIMEPNPLICPAVTDLLNQAEASDEFQDRWNRTSVPLLEEFSAFLYRTSHKEKFTVQDDLTFAYYCSCCYSCHNHPVPEAYSQSLFDRLADEVIWYQNYIHKYPDRQTSGRYRVGPLWRLTQNRINHIVDPQTRGDTQNLFVLAGHDLGPMLTMLGALGVELQRWTPYASMIELAVYQKKDANGVYNDSDENSYFVGASYDGKPITLPYPCDSIENSFNLCSWKQWLTFVGEMTPTYAECPGLDLHDELRKPNLTEAERAAFYSLAVSNTVSVIGFVSTLMTAAFVLI